MAWGNSSSTELRLTDNIVSLINEYATSSTVSNGLEAHVRKKKALPTVSKWTDLLANCETKEKSEIAASIKHFLFKNPDAHLPMRYTRTDNTTQSVLEYASEDKELLTKLKQRQ